MDYTFWFVNWFSFVFSLLLLFLLIFNINQLGSIADFAIRINAILVVISFIICFYTMVSKEKTSITCKDGWISYSEGSGTCSHHGGIDHRNYKYWFDK